MVAVDHLAAMLLLPPVAIAVLLLRRRGRSIALEVIFPAKIKGCASLSSVCVDDAAYVSAEKKSR